MTPWEVLSRSVRVRTKQAGKTCVGPWGQSVKSRMLQYLVSTTLGSGVIGINVVGDSGDSGIAASSSSKICETIASIRVPRARK